MVMGGGRRLLVSIDVEHTGNGAYSSDITQVGADAHIFDATGDTPTLVPAALDGEQWTFRSDVKSQQKLSRHLPSHFHLSFPFTRLFAGPPFTDVMAELSKDILALKAEHKLEQVLFVGHKVLTCDAVVLEFNFARAAMSFCDFQQSLGVEGWVDTFTSLKEIKEFKLLKNFDLGTIYQEVTGCLLENAHDALADARATSRVLQHPPCLVWLAEPTNFIGRKSTCLSSFAKRQKDFCYIDKPELCPGKFSQEEMFSQEVRVRCYWTIVLNF